MNKAIKYRQDSIKRFESDMGDTTRVRKACRRIAKIYGKNYDPTQISLREIHAKDDWKGRGSHKYRQNVDSLINICFFY